MMRGVMIGVFLLIAACSSFTEATSDPVDTTDAGAEAGAPDGSMIDGMASLVDAGDGEAGPTNPMVCTEFDGAAAPADWTEIQTGGGQLKFQQGAVPAIQAAIDGTQSATLSHHLNPGPDGTVDVTVDLSVKNSGTSSLGTELVRLVCDPFMLRVEINAQGTMDMLIAPGNATAIALGDVPTSRTQLEILLAGGTATVSLGGVSQYAPTGTPAGPASGCTLTIGATATTNGRSTTATYFESCNE